jgi:hypothetical protein
MFWRATPTLVLGNQTMTTNYDIVEFRNVGEFCVYLNIIPTHFLARLARTLLLHHYKK